MFCNIKILTSIALVFTGAIAFFGLVHPHSDDKAQYEKFIGSTVVGQRSLANEQRPTHQLRKGVRKDFWLPGRHFRIQSLNSAIWVLQQKDKFEITENLEEATCCLQEDSSDTLQEIKWLTAKKGQFSYPSNRFEANEAALTIFSMEGRDFPETIPLIPFTSYASADSSTYEWPNNLHLQGNVRLFSTRFQAKKTFALADELYFHPSSGNLELRASPLKKVLFWQDEMRLSSPAIEICRDSLQKTEQIKGLGDVHFYFTGEEDAMFYKIFGIKI